MTTPGNLTLSTLITWTDFQTLLAVNTTSLLAESLGKIPQVSIEDPVYAPKFLRAAILRAPPVYNSEQHIRDEEVIECDLELTAYRYANVSATGSNFTVGSRTKLPLDPKGAELSSPPAVQSDLGIVTFHTPGLPPLSISGGEWSAIIQFFRSQLVPPQGTALGCHMADHVAGLSRAKSPSATTRTPPLACACPG